MQGVGGSGNCAAGTSNPRHYGGCRYLCERAFRWRHRGTIRAPKRFSAQRTAPHNSCCCWPGFPTGTHSTSIGQAKFCSREPSFAAPFPGPADHAGSRAQGTGHWTGHWTGHSPRLAPATNGVAAAALLLRQRPSFLPAPAPGIAAVALGPGPWAQGLCARHTGRAAPPRRVSEEEVRIPKLRRRRRR